MALVVADRVKETTTSTGTGTIDLAGAVAGFQTFVAGVGDTNTTYYAIIDPAGGTWEVGIGTVTDSTPDTLSRDTILASSNSGSAVNFGAGNKNVFSTQPADKAVYLDSSGQLVIGGVAVTSTAAELNYVDGVTSNIQTQLDAKVDLSGDTMTGALTLSGAPTADLHATTKLYVDELIAAGIHYHDPVRVESPDGDGNLTATYDNGTNGVGATLTNNGTQAALVIDGVTLATSDRVLIYNQTNAFENGIYTVTNTGSASTNWVLTRATDADSYGVDNQSLSEGTSVFVLEGDDGSGEVYACTTTGTITFGTTAINFSQIGKSAVITGGTGITVASNEVSANVSATAQTTAANSLTTTASRTYAVQPDSSDNLVVNVPWTDTTTNQTITLSGDASGSGTTSISVSLATDSVGSNEIAANAVSASELNVTGDGTTSQFLRSDGDGSFTWATPTDTNTTYSAGSGLSLTGTTFANTAPDQTVSLTGSGATTVTGTYPNFTISSTDTDTNTTYSTATSSVLGLVKIGYTENGKNYPVELSSGQMFVNVPWVDTNTTYSVGDGGLTQVNFTTARRDKLNGIESGATADQTASEILTAIKTVDGSGSGLDADTLDGAQPSVSASNSTIVQRHSSGYIFANYFNTTANDVSSGVTRVMVETGNDNYIRHGTQAAIRTFIGAGSGNGLDADLLDGQHGSYYLNYNNLSNQPVIPPAANNATITLSAGTGLSGGGNFTTNQSSAETITFNLEAPYTYIDQATGNYGTIKVDDDRGVTWAGYAIRDDWVFMSDGATNCGIYNDTDNEWAIICRQNAEVELYHNASMVCETSSGGLVLPIDTTDVLNFTANSTNDSRGISFNGRTALSADYNDGYLRLNNNAEFNNGVYVPGVLRTTNRLSSDSQVVGGRSSVTSGGQLAVSSTGSPYLSFHESATRRCYFQYLTTDHNVLYYNEEGYYHRFQSNQTAVGLTLYTAGSNRRGYLYADASNNIGLLDSDGQWAYRHARDSLHEWRINNSIEMLLESDGDLHVDGDVIAFSTTVSDERLKKDITPIKDALEKVNQLSGNTFEYTTDNRVSAGVIAQEVERVLPEAVREKKLAIKEELGDEAYKVVSYDAVVGLLVEAVKELSAKVKALETK